LRGGSWNNNPNNMRSANRNRNSTDNRNNNNGFRLVQSAHEARVESFKDDSSVHWVSMSLFPALAWMLWANSCAMDGVWWG